MAPWCVRRVKVEPGTRFLDRRFHPKTVAVVAEANTFEEAVRKAFSLAKLSPHRDYRFLVRRCDRGPFHSSVMGLKGQAR